MSWDPFTGYDSMRFERVSFADERGEVPDFRPPPARFHRAEHFADEPYNSPAMRVGWEIPETQWVTWGGETVLPPVNVVDPNAPFQETARIELSTPRAVFVTLFVDAPPASIVEAQVTQGIGRAEMVRTFALTGGQNVDVVFPTRISRFLVRESTASAGNAQINFLVMAAPIFPDADMRKAPTLR